jgi:hypothetical protein
VVQRAAVRCTGEFGDSEIAVSADRGTVTLRGTVRSFRQRREAGKATERVYGVLAVNNDLDVRILDEKRHEDADLRCSAMSSSTPRTSAWTR